jgi:GH35 family endo-1,4-beta-xylanase
VIQAEKAAIKTEGGPLASGGWNLWSNGRVGQPLRVTMAGNYIIEIRAWGSSAAGVWPEMALWVDGQTIKTITVGSDKKTEYGFVVEMAAGIHEVAAAFLNDAVIGQEDRNLYLERITILSPQGSAEPELVSKHELAEAAEKREQEIVAATQEDIEKFRKSDAKIRVVDAGGRPLSAVMVSVQQTSHAFLFGCNIYMFGRYKDDARNAEYKKRFAELFNYATVGVYWRSYETQQGKPNYEDTDKVVDWCREHGIQMKGHPLLWGDRAGIPRWSRGLPSDEIQRRRVQDIVGQYRGRIEFWEVVNEPSHQAEPKIDQPYRWARDADPNARLIVNDYHVLADGCPEFFKLLAAAKRRGVPFDVIGIQSHEPRAMRFPLDRVKRILDQYASLGKELNVTEFTPTSASRTIVDSYRDGVWDEASQAEYAVKFYRVCFAHPSMRAITWWDLCDEGSWLPGGGMLRADMSPKPVYNQLKRLIHDEWLTRLTLTTDADGRLAFRGFRGKYRLVFRWDGHEVERQFGLSRGKDREVVVAIAP